MNNKTKQLDWRKERTVDTIAKDAKVVLSDDTFIAATELSEKADVSQIKKDVEKLDSAVDSLENSRDDIRDDIEFLYDRTKENADAIEATTSPMDIIYIDATHGEITKDENNQISKWEDTEHNILVTKTGGGEFKYDRSDNNPRLLLHSTAIDVLGLGKALKIKNITLKGQLYNSSQDTALLQAQTARYNVETLAVESTEIVSMPISSSNMQMLKITASGGYVYFWLEIEAQWTELAYKRDIEVHEAPADDKQYARMNGEWSEVKSEIGDRISFRAASGAEVGHLEKTSADSMELMSLDGLKLHGSESVTVESNGSLNTTVNNITTKCNNLKIDCDDVTIDSTGGLSIYTEASSCIVSNSGLDIRVVRGNRQTCEIELGNDINIDTLGAVKLHGSTVQIKLDGNSDRSLEVDKSKIKLRTDAGNSITIDDNNNRINLVSPEIRWVEKTASGDKEHLFSEELGSILDNEKVTAAALVELNNRITELENKLNS